MGIINSNKSASKKQINCNGSFDVTLALSAVPDIMGVQNEIALVLDSSGSMSGQPLERLKKGVIKFLDTLDYDSDGKADGIIGNNNEVALVSFSTNAKIEVGLTNSTQTLKNKLATITASGSTNHADAFRKGIDALTNSSGKEKTIIIFTDGQSNKGMEGFAVAEEAKAKGINIFCIGYGDEKNLNENSLRLWASYPSESFTYITPSLDEIELAFEKLVRNELKQGASLIKIEDTVSDCFEIENIVSSSTGVATITGPKSVNWEIDKLGEHHPEGATVTFKVKHTGGCLGDIPVNQSISYSDAENNIVDFQNPTVNVLCESTEITEECPQPQNILLEGCADSVSYVAEDVSLSGLGRIVQIDAAVKNVCPNKRVALAITLSETDAQGTEHPRGLKTFVLPAQTGDSCKDIIIRCVKFVLPEELDLNGNSDSICDDRHFKATVFANYIDTDFRCCK